MTSKQREIFEIFTGTLISQEIVIQLLHRKGLIDKGEVIRSLDEFIDHFEQKDPEQKITVPMHYLRSNLRRDLPESCSSGRRKPERKNPPWLQGVIVGGRYRSGALLGDCLREEDG
jgi:hypothetical protein